MFSRILIANRGEIACRIIRTCRRLGIETVAVHSEADAGARHVREADVAVCIGPAPAARSYLDAERIVEVARDHGAQAIHPGYGFLSERLALVEACERVGIVFVGPHKDAIARMGSKIESKRIARQADVPCVPGYDGDDQTLEALAREARGIGFPLLVKASAGGGGKGMRLVRSPEDLERELQAAKAQARAAFGDDRVLLERCIERPRHVEVQLLGDRHGGLVHLFERECSIQRHYQKLVEEAPAAFLGEAVRHKLYDHALRLGRAIRYDSAGTVEFVLDADRDDEPYFLEMNTRLQVEHPVTEVTTGLDLVECQLRSAAGERLAVAQETITRSGWAIEARVNAEVPAEGYAASFGRVTRYLEPPPGPGLRIDSGIDGSSEVVPHYDSLVAKVIGFGPTREAARRRLLQGLAALRIEGVRTTQRMLMDVLSHRRFQERLTTRFLADAFPDGWRTDEAAERELQAAAAAAWFFASLPEPASPLAALTGFRLTAASGARASCPVLVDDGQRTQEIVVVPWSPSCVACRDGAGERVFDRRGAAIIATESGVTFEVDVGEGEVTLWSAGEFRRLRLTPRVARPAPKAGPAMDDRVLQADLPGLLKELLVQPGDEVAANQPVAVLEAMKLFHTLVAPARARVTSVSDRLGQTVNKGDVIVSFDSVAAEPHPHPAAEPGSGPGPCPRSA